MNRSVIPVRGLLDKKISEEHLQRSSDKRIKTKTRRKKEKERKYKTKNSYSCLPLSFPPPQETATRTAGFHSSQVLSLK